MDDDEKKFFRKRNPFFDMFGEFDKMDEMMEEMMKKAFDDIGKARGKPMSYGFSIKMPEGWEKGIPSGKKVVIYSPREGSVDISQEKAHVDIEINVDIEELPVGMGLDEYYEKIMKVMHDRNRIKSMVLHMY